MTRADLMVAVTKAKLTYLSAEAALAAAETAVSEYDSNPPEGTLLRFDDRYGATAHAIRVRGCWDATETTFSDGPGWRVIWGDFSGNYYPDSDGGLSKFHLSNPTEVYRP